MAESVDEDTDISYMGLHFPATDVPQRTRDSYRLSHVRQVCVCVCVRARARACVRTRFRSAQAIRTNDETIRVLRW